MIDLGNTEYFLGVEVKQTLLRFNMDQWNSVVQLCLETNWLKMKVVRQLMPLELSKRVAQPV
jgi:hypothetical protein